ncbi:ROK family transcriptional regulator [Actinomadura rupiterrae]|uniref:ROK family transcriptional regulator n=1 Tax=Actinomadura rupiterrae TaxID=559627 RepID=UPI0020A5747F|nr:ROK family transcriptional regulator [Actinomadura rupiterrae]MCP2336155.1 putative NBD/HSP70 family sugar kinase [Actinomadura rupiterrae]
MTGPARTQGVRRHNLSLLLRHLDEHGPCSRTELAQATGLVPASVTTLVTDLISRGLVTETETGTGGAARGRPRRPLRVAPGRVGVIAVRVSLERLDVLTADLAGPTLHQTSVPHGATFGDAAALAAAIAELIDAARDGERTFRAAIAMAGPITGETVAAAIDFGWPSTDLRALVDARLSAPLPIDIVNDANVAALAEYRALAARGVRHPETVAYIKADTGVGGGLLVNGRVHSGSHGTAGEVGHMPLTLDGPPCACGARGCLAVYAGPEPLTRAAGIPSPGSRASLDELDRRLRAGDAAAVGAVRAAGRALGAAILGVSALADAGEVILGGYLASWEPWLSPGIDEQTAGRRALVPGLQPTVTRGVLGSDAALRGALQTGRDAVLADPAAVPVLETDRTRTTTARK